MIFKTNVKEFARIARRGTCGADVAAEHDEAVAERRLLAGLHYRGQGFFRLFGRKRLCIVAAQAETRGNSYTMRVRDYRGLIKNIT